MRSADGIRVAILTATIIGGWFAVSRGWDGTQQKDRPLAEELESRAIDLTYTFDEQTINWPADQPFHWEKMRWGHGPDGHWYASARYESSEHVGTHLDSPIHFAEGKATTDQIPLEKLIGPAIVVDIETRCAEDRDYQLRVDDLDAWERKHGPIPAGSIVLVRTGWGRYWPDRDRYLGSARPGDVEHLHFPGIAPEAARRLVERRVDGVGIDTASLDHGPSRDFRTHRILCTANLFGLENVAHLDRLPATGATLIALPMKIGGGSGGPTRVIAILP